MNNIIFDSTQDLLAQLAEDLRLLSQNGKKSHISISGGATFNLLFEYLANASDMETINWQQIHFWWTDERCVAATDSESHYGQCKQRLFDKIVIPTENIHPIQGEKDPEQEVIRYSQEIEKEITEVNGMPQFDWIILGIGNDGHTASLFPEQTNYADRRLIFVATRPQCGQLHISQTGHLIAQSKRITYLAIGKKKADIMHKINSLSDSRDRYPAARIASATGLTQYYLDSDAAKQLQQGKRL